MPRLRPHAWVKTPRMWWRDFVLLVGLLFGFPPVGTTQPINVPVCHGQAVQAGLLICEAPGAEQLIVSGLDGEHQRFVPVNEDGRATIGLRQDEALSLVIRISTEADAATLVDLAERDDPLRTIEGFDCDKVDARTPEQKAHAGESWVKKQAAFGSFSTGPGATTGFLPPADGPMSSPFGPARKYIGVGKDGTPCEKTSIHRGYDLAVPVGTPITAPAGGTVSLGDPDLYYEGGTVFLDHGDGLVSVFMHMSQVDVTAGQVVTAGERLGASGNTGRTTGPHLHWAVKWRNPGSEDRSQDFYIDPALLLLLDPAP